MGRLITRNARANDRVAAMITWLAETIDRNTELVGRHSEMLDRDAEMVDRHSRDVDLNSLLDSHMRSLITGSGGLVDGNAPSLDKCPETIDRGVTRVLPDDTLIIHSTAPIDNNAATITY